MASVALWGGYYFSPTGGFLPGQTAGFTWFLPSELWVSTFSVAAVPVTAGDDVRGEVQVGPLSISMTTHQDPGRRFDVQLHAPLINIGPAMIEAVLIYLSRVGP